MIVLCETRVDLAERRIVQHDDVVVQAAALAPQHQQQIPGPLAGADDQQAATQDVAAHEQVDDQTGAAATEGEADNRAGEHDHLVATIRCSSVPQRRPGLHQRQQNCQGCSHADDHRHPCEGAVGVQDRFPLVKAHGEQHQQVE